MMTKKRNQKGIVELLYENEKLLPRLTAAVCAYSLVRR